MVNLSFKDDFKRKVKKLNNFLKSKVYKQVEKIIQNPEIGKPMRYGRKGTREVYIKPYRLSYAYIKEKDKIILLDLYHKNGQ